MIIDANGKCPFEIRDSTGKEFKKIYDADGNLLFKNWNTIQGTPPIVFKGYNRSLKNYKIYGNTVQNGTPSSEAPVDVVGCGVRTRNIANLYGVNKKALNLTFTEGNNMTIKINGTKVNGMNVVVVSYPNIMLHAGTYTVKIKMIGGSITNITGGVMFGINQSTYGMRTTPQVNTIGQIGTRTFTLNEDTLLTSLDITPSYGDAGAVFNDAEFECWLYSGSDVIPYEPYGYKLPVTISNGVFLDEPLRGIGEYKDTLDLSTGVVTRRIKKLVLTGRESDWRSAGEGSTRLYNHTIGTGDSYSSEVLCNVAEYSDSVATSSGVAFDIVAYKGSLVVRFHAIDFTRLNDFKSYLATQYAAGTPVTVWYVLAEPETETVSVPSGLSGIIEGYCIQDGTPTPENPIEVVSNGTVQSDGTYLVPRTAQFITTPIYIGSEPLHKINDYADYIDFERGVVVRRIKKLVLTGEESMTKAASNPVFTMQLGGKNTPFSENAVTTLSTHYQAQNNVAGTGNVNDMSVCVRRGYGTMYIGDTRYDNTTDFKSYLATQYAAGTPVTVWYVLAEPEETPLSDLDPITPLKGVNTLSTNATIQPSEIYLKGKIKSLATHILVDSSGNILLTSNNYQLVTKEE